MLPAAKQANERLHARVTCQGVGKAKVQGFGADGRVQARFVRRKPHADSSLCPTGADSFRNGSVTVCLKARSALAREKFVEALPRRRTRFAECPRGARRMTALTERVRASVGNARPSSQRATRAISSRCPGGRALSGRYGREARRCCGAGRRAPDRVSTSRSAAVPPRGNTSSRNPLVRAYSAACSPAAGSQQATTSVVFAALGPVHVQCRPARLRRAARHSVSALRPGKAAAAQLTSASQYRHGSTRGCQAHSGPAGVRVLKPLPNNSSTEHSNTRANASAAVTEGVSRPPSMALTDVRAMSARRASSACDQPQDSTPTGDRALSDFE